LENQEKTSLLQQFLPKYPKKYIFCGVGTGLLLGLKPCPQEGANLVIYHYKKRIFFGFLC